MSQYYKRRSFEGSDMDISLHDEVETRFLVKSFGGVKDALLALGGVCVWRGVEEIRYFDTPDGEFREQGKRIRIKTRKGAPASLQYKSFLPDIELGDKRYKVRIESESIECESFKDATRMARKLWHPGVVEVEAWRYRKRRAHWVLGDTVVELDTLIDLNGEKYVEIEGAIENIDRVAEELKLDWSSVTCEGYRQEHVRKRAVA